MARSTDPNRLARDIGRLTGVTPRRVSDGLRFRVRCETADGEAHTVSLQIDTHVKQTRPYVLRQLSAALRLTDGELLRALDDWGPDDLAVHLKKFTKQQLSPPRRFNL